MTREPNKKIDEILESLDHVKRASAPDFFYTRLKARMEKGYEPSVKRPWVLRPVYALTALALVILLNAAVILQRNNANDVAGNGTDTEAYQSIAAEYNLDDNITEEVYK
jgi:hypothetical protein